jgi:hypothetical protein
VSIPYYHPRRDGRNRVSPGINIIISNAMHSPAINGNADREIILRSMPDIPEAVTRFTPTGGVICPIARLTVIIIPK